MLQNRLITTILLLLGTLVCQAQIEDILQHRSHSKSEATETEFSFIVAGHAYGSHDASNLGLHPALLNSLDIVTDTNVKFIVLTGDIVRTSNTESWQQVEEELNAYAFSSYYSMGNHDYNDAGIQVFTNKFGDVYYDFYWQGNLFIVLNTIESDRSVSEVQMLYLNRTLNLSEAWIKNVFVFFHEVIWNSDEKYSGVRSNSRSRYDQVKEYSNYWDDVHPVLKMFSDKNFYLFAGDVGGNPDAIAAFYDKRDNVTLVASGMGEVDDENYLQVNVYSNDSVELELVPLDPNITLPELKYFSVPPAPDSIIGPDTILPGSDQIEYYIDDIPYITAYEWVLPESMSGFSTTSSLFVDIDSGFVEDTLLVYAERDGFGKGPAAFKIVAKEEETNTVPWNDHHFPNIEITADRGNLIVSILNMNEEAISLRCIDSRGSVRYSEQLPTGSGDFSRKIPKSILPEGIVLISVTTNESTYTSKYLNF